MSISETYVAVQGWIGSDIRYREVSDGLPVVTFRLATTPRQFDRSAGGWTDRPTNWFTVECWRALAANVKQSMERGHPVVVTGRFRTTEWQDEEGAPRSRLVLEAFGIGHDLSRGTSTFVKSTPRPQLQETPPLDQDRPTPLHATASSQPSDQTQPADPSETQAPQPRAA